MTVPRWNAIQRAWESAPPVHMMIANFFGYKRRSAIDQESLIAALMQSPPEGVVVNG
ncbi:hypothetical protein [Burkholderia ubonensis]|uniref:hypothetical protein n=1 Tax=Burkholderia ubonensis TaxID=101571 RepID=UPI000A9BC45B|nr:hypothetical protein [Burkholderia ubonensis]